MPAVSPSRYFEAFSQFYLQHYCRKAHITDDDSKNIAYCLLKKTQILISFN